MDCELRKDASYPALMAELWGVFSEVFFRKGTARCQECTVYWRGVAVVVRGGWWRRRLWWWWCKYTHDDVIKWKHFPRYWPFVREIHRSPVNSPHKGQWRGALKFSLICAWINAWVNNGEAGDLRRYRAHYNCNERGKRWWAGEGGEWMSSE